MPPPLRGEVLYFVDRIKQGLRRQFVADGSIESFHIRILLWISGLNVFDADAAFVDPVLQCCTDVLQAVVAPSNAWAIQASTPGNDLVPATDHPFGRRREIDVDAQRFPIEVIDDAEQPNASAVAQLVIHEIHGPNLNDRRWHCQRRRLFPHHAFLRLHA